MPGQVESSITGAGKGTGHRLVLRDARMAACTRPGVHPHQAPLGISSACLLPKQEAVGQTEPDCLVSTWLNEA